MPFKLILAYWRRMQLLDYVPHGKRQPLKIFTLIMSDHQT